MIHWSVVSSVRSRSWFVSSPGGVYVPIAVIFAPRKEPPR